jgi:putative endonuclease
MEKQPAVYILAHRRYGVLYTGVTSNLTGRVWQHRTHVVDGFTTKFNVATLVW